MPGYNMVSSLIARRSARPQTQWQPCRKSIIGGFKIFKILNFRNSILKLAVHPSNIYNFKFIWSVVLKQTEN